jgi:hypothetical protein
MNEIATDSVTICTSAVQSDVVLIVKVEDAMHRVITWAIGIIFATRVVSDVELRRIGAKGTGGANLVARTARGGLPSLQIKALAHITERIWFVVRTCEATADAEGHYEGAQHALFVSRVRRQISDDEPKEAG